MSASVQMAAGSGAETWWPMYIGCVRRVTLGRISRRSRSSTASSGFPSTGSGPAKWAASSAGVWLVPTRPSPAWVWAR